MVKWLATFGLAHVADLKHSLSNVIHEFRSLLSIFKSSYAIEQGWCYRHVVSLPVERGRGEVSCPINTSLSRTVDERSYN